MPARPVIGVPTQTLEAVGGDLPRCWVMSQRYVSVLASVGAVPWMIPLLEQDTDTLRCTYDQLDAVFLAGGVDVDPSSYGETRHELCGRTDPARDWAELSLVRWALEDRKPVLGVCRGLQLINVASGGTLYQDVSLAHGSSIKHDYFPPAYPRDLLVHNVEITEASRLRDVLDTPTATVNSMHHQGIRDLGAGLAVSAMSPDGVIEGIESADDRFLVAAQWHPEELVDSDPGMRRLFTGLVSAASEYRQDRSLDDAAA